MLGNGRYEVEAELGRGAMGVVYLAHDLRVRRRVALKTFSAPAGFSEEQKKDLHDRLLREGQAAGSLVHPGIVTIFDVDEDTEHEFPFIAMEYVPGRTLQQLLDAKGRLERDRAFSIVDSLADALQAAHHAGIVHSDIKPSNILVRDADGAVKIADFGVARLDASELTGAGLSAGSPAYMAPEQIEGKQPDPRSDLFSLAVILYQALSGRRPFEGNDIPSIAYAIVHKEPEPLGATVPGLGRDIDYFFSRALAKQPSERYRNAAAFRKALEEVRARCRDDSEWAYRTMMVPPSALTSPQPPADQEEASPSDKPLEPAEPTLTPRTSEPSARGAAGAKTLPFRTQLVYLVGCLLLFLTVLTWSVGKQQSGPSSTGAPAIAAGEVSTPTPITAPAEVAAAPSPLAPSGAFRATVGEGSPAKKRPVPVGGPKLQLRTKNEPGPRKTPAGGASNRDVPRTGAPAHETTASRVEPISALAAPVASSDPGEPAGTSTAAAEDPAYLELTIKSSVKQGTLVLFVDGEPVFTEELTAASKGVKRFTKKVFGRREESAERLAIPPGRHEVMARLTSEAGAKDYEDHLTLELTAGQSASLRIVAGRAFGQKLQLELGG